MKICHSLKLMYEAEKQKEIMEILSRINPELATAIREFAGL